MSKLMPLKEVREVIKNEFKGKSYIPREDDPKRGSCKYFMNDGKKCAIGLFLPNAEFYKDFGDDSWGLFEKDETLLDYMPCQDESKLHQWQIFHDETLDPFQSVEAQGDALFNAYVRLTKDLYK